MKGYFWQGELLENPPFPVFLSGFTNISGELGLANYTMKNETERICLIKPKMSV